MTRESLANEIWRACHIMRRDDNCGGVMEYVEHLSWLLFLCFLDAQEEIFEQEAALADRTYTRVLDEEFRWSNWARKDWKSGELLPFVQGNLIPELRKLSGSPERDIIRGIFADRPVVVMASPYNLKDVLSIIDGINFHSQDDIHTVSFVYEDLLQRLGSENRIAGEFYTPRPVVRFIVEVLDPKIGETVYDPACGSCGFLAEAYEHMRRHVKGTRDYARLQHETFVGQEKKPLPSLLGLMNTVLHGVLTPDIRRRNTLEDNIRDVSERFDVIMTNPPFGGKENRQIQQNFPVQVQATELLFVQHIMKKLKAEGRCGMVVPEGVLFRGDAFARVKEDLLEQFTLHTVISLPQGVFLPYSAVKTNLIFFQRPGPTREVWYYELQPPNRQRYTKAKPIQDADFDDCRAKMQERTFSENSWIVPAEELIKQGYDLTARNPNRAEDDHHREPAEIISSITEKEKEILSLIGEVEGVLKGANANN